MRKVKNQTAAGTIIPAAVLLRLHQIDRHLIPRSAFQDSTCPFLLHATPLFEEKWDLGSQALISNIRDPFLHERSRTGTRLDLVWSYDRLTHHNGMDMTEAKRPSKSSSATLYHLLVGRGL